MGNQSDIETYAQAGVLYKKADCLQWQRLHEDSIVPVRKTVGSAGFDLHLIDSVLVRPGQTVRVRTGLAVAIPLGMVGFIKPRSSAYATGLDLDGTIDSDYRGEVLLQIRNTSSESVGLAKGDRVAQLVVLPVYTGPSITTEKLSETSRGAGGFGSTGK